MDKQPGSRTCFLCGRENPMGLKLTWYNDKKNQQVYTDVIIPEHFNGFPGFAHGGIVAALLDETAGRAVMIDGDSSKLMLTTGLEVKYRRPTPTETPLKVIGWIITEVNEHARVAGEVRLPDGTVTAACEATVVKPPEKYFKLWNWEEEQKHWKV